MRLCILRKSRNSCEFVLMIMTRICRTLSAGKCMRLAQLLYERTLSVNTRLSLSVEVRFADSDHPRCY